MTVSPYIAQHGTLTTFRAHKKYALAAAKFAEAANFATGAGGDAENGVGSGERSSAASGTASSAAARQRTRKPSSTVPVPVMSRYPRF